MSASLRSTHHSQCRPAAVHHQILASDVRGFVGCEEDSYAISRGSAFRFIMVSIPRFGCSFADLSSEPIPSRTAAHCVYATPGHTPFTRILSPTRSSARHRVISTTAAFDALYVRKPG